MHVFLRLSCVVASSLLPPASRWPDHNSHERKAALLRFLLPRIPLLTLSFALTVNVVTATACCTMAEDTIRKPGRESRKHIHPVSKTATTQAKSQVQTQAQMQSSTTVSQYTTVETSVEVVQTLTQAVVSSMARLRHLFDDDNYAAKLIDMTDAKKSGSALQFESLRRGVTSRADRLLDWTVC
jgi:hypothetical protein